MSNLILTILTATAMAAIAWTLATIEDNDHE